MRRVVLIAALGLLGLGAPTAKAGTWWVLNSTSGACLHATAYGPAFASPFALAAEMRQAGRLNAPVEQKRTTSGSVYAVTYDGMVTTYFTGKAGCEEFLAWARKRGDLP